MEYETIQLAIADGIARLTLDRPNVLNALNERMLAELRDATATVSRQGARALVLTGTGRGFCAGADLSGMAQPDADRTSLGERVSRNMETSFNPMIRDLRELPIPKVAAVNGVAAGGGVSVALACDIVLAARSSYFVFVFGPRLGLVPDLGATWHLPRLVGAARARGLALLGDRLDAASAAAWGLIWKCVEDADLAAEALALATRLREGPTQAFAAISRALDTALDNGFAAQLDAERKAQGVLAATEDFMEGVTAFNAKRAPVFRGR